MKEGAPIYNEEGQITDPGVARKAAEIEGPYHTKKFGIFSPSKGKIEEGEFAAELGIEQASNIGLDELPSSVTEEVDRNILSLAKTNGEVLQIDKALKGDLGGGVTRYRIFGQINEGTSSVSVPGPVGTNIPISVPVDHWRGIQLVIDEKDGAIERSELKEGSFDI